MSLQSKAPVAAQEFAAYLDNDDILCQTPIRGHDELLMEMLKRLAFNRGIGNVPSIFDAVLQREKAGATVVAGGVAIPHARIPTIHSPIISIATSREGVDFPECADEADGGRAKLIILVLVPKDQPSLYLQILSAIGKILAKNPGEVAETCAALPSAQDVENFFRRNGVALPNFVCAADIMEPLADKLLEHDSLKDAIDMFVSRGLHEVPVVDKDGDMTGVVTADALLKVCMPDYLLWMDDLSPIMQFEPFVNILRNEENTWLSDILRQECPCVQTSQPAIAVAEAMAKRNAGVCYVLDGKRLAGVVTLPRFLDKVLRD